MKQNILITGHSRGIGNYLGKSLSDKHTIFGISRNRTNNFICEEEFKIDLAQEKTFHEVQHYFETNGKKIDTLVLNAGIGYFGNFFYAEKDTYHDIIHTNLLSNIYLIQNLESIFSTNINIIFIGSIIGKKSLTGAAVYQASKFGLRGFAMGLKNELKKKKVFVINPSIVDTDFHNKIPGNIQLPKGKETSLIKILETVENCIKGTETRFEIDL